MQRSPQEITHTSLPKKKHHEALQTTDDPMGGLFGGNTLLYFFVGIATVSLGVSLFLYKEVKKVKKDVNDIGGEIKNLKEQSEIIEENTKLVQGLDEKVNKLGIMLQHSLSGKVTFTPPPPKQTLTTPTATSEVKETKDDDTQSGGPFDDDREDREDCEDGVCRIPKKEGKILEI